MATKLTQIEKRLQQLETEMQEMKQSNANSKGQCPWYDQILGMFDDDPGFDEMVRRGKAIRDADRGLAPPRRKRVTSRKGSR